MGHVMVVTIIKHNIGEVNETLELVETIDKTNSIL